ncbi:MAG: ABC transporter ATP-binding protein [Steroidobacteraceae bacterium]
MRAATNDDGDAVLVVDNLTVDLPPDGDRRHAVEGVSFTLGAREILCIVGESGSGKSLTAQAIMGLLPGPHVRASAGSIRFEGRDLLRLGEPELRAIRGARIGMIFQEPMTALNPVMRIGDQIAEVLRFHGRRKAPAGRIVELLAAVGLPDPETLRHVYPFRLSGGQRQRVMIAMALALDPAILIADEPTTALDVTTQAQILALIRSIQAARNMAVLFITHDFGVVAEIAHRVAVMHEGRLVEIGPTAEVLNAPRHDYTRRLLGAVPRLLPRRPRAIAPGPPLLAVENLRKTFITSAGWFRPKRITEAVKDVAFEVRAGETMGIVGESGSGKSTVARCLVRLIEADRGSVAVAGIPGDFLHLRPAALRTQRRKVQIIFQDPYASLNPRRSVGDIIAQGPIAHGEPPAAVHRRVRELLALVGLDPASAERYPHEFSGGQRQRIGIARALALEPRLLVADEPVSALDVSVQAQVLELLENIRRRLGLAMIFITHDLRVAAQVCDNVAVMCAGEIVEYGATAEVLIHPRHDYTRQLLASIPGRNWASPADRAATGDTNRAYQGIRT